MNKIAYLLWLIGGIFLAVSSFLLFFFLFGYGLILYTPIFLIFLYIGSVLLLFLNKDKSAGLKVILFGIEPLVLFLSLIIAVSSGGGGLLMAGLLLSLISFINLVITLMRITAINYALIRDINDIQEYNKTKNELSIIKLSVGAAVLVAGFIISQDMFLNTSDMHGLGAVIAFIALPISILFLLGGYIALKKVTK